jgi:hypothetical protein
VTGGKPIAVLLQSILGVTTINTLVAFYDIHGGNSRKFCPGHHTRLQIHIDMFNPYIILNSPVKTRKPSIALCYYNILCKKNNVPSTERYAVHLQFDISANALKIRAVQSLKSDVLLTTCKNEELEHKVSDDHRCRHCKACFPWIGPVLEC